MDKTPLESKKFIFGLTLTGAIMCAGVLAVSAGMSVPAALPLVLDGLKWLAGIYIGVQGGQDITQIFKNKSELK